ncbi:MAG: AAA family ATPase [Gemmataceae bacterium]
MTTEASEEILAKVIGRKAPSFLQDLSTFRLSSVRPMPLSWWVPRYVPRGKLVLLAGDGGHGKSTLTLSLASDLSQGRCALGLEYPDPKQCETLLVQCEDDVADTVLPRFLAAGGNPDCIHQLEGVFDDKGKIQHFGLEHYEALERFLEKRKEVGLVLIDPAGAYIGKSGVDDYKDSQLRTLLAPLSQLAERAKVAIILVKHFIKGATAKAVHKVGGGVGYVNAVRAAFAVVPKQGEPEKRMFLPLKYNIGHKPPGLVFQMQELPAEQSGLLLHDYMQHLSADQQQELVAQLFRIKWLGEVDIDVDDAIAALPSESADKVDDATEWLREFLSMYAYPSKEVITAGNKEGYSFKDIKTARERLKKQGGLYTQKEGYPAQWWVGLGKPELRKKRPDPAQEWAGE